MRVAPALVFGGLMLVPTLVLIMISTRGGSTFRWATALSYLALLALAIVGLGAVLFSGGFTIGGFP